MEEFDTTTLTEEETILEADDGTNEAEIESETEDTTDVEQEEEAEAEEESTEETAEEPSGLTIKYNGQSIDIDHEQAVTLAQKGMKFDSMSDMLNKLNYIAAVNNQSADKFINDMFDSHEQMVRDKYSEMADDEEMLSALIEAEHNKNKKAFEKIQKQIDEESNAQTQKQVDKLAEEFGELQKSFPNIKEFKDVNKSVLALAQKEKISLLDAQLRFEHENKIKSTKAKTDAAKAKKASTGNAKSDGASDNDIDGMLKGIWG